MLVRPRRPDDVPAVCSLIERQQPLTQYPLRDPLPFPMEQFVVRRTELAAWVAEETRDTRAGVTTRHVVGHVSALEVRDDRISQRWSEALDRPVAELGAVGVMVVDHDCTGRGIGRLLLDACEQWLLDEGRGPVLEVMAAHRRAADLYRRRGWRSIGTDRPTWLPDDMDDQVELMVLDG